MTDRCLIQLTFFSVWCERSGFSISALIGCDQGSSVKTLLKILFCSPLSIFVSCWSSPRKLMRFDLQSQLSGWMYEQQSTLGLTLLIMFMSVADILTVLGWWASLSCWCVAAVIPVWAHCFYTPESHPQLCVAQRWVSTCVSVGNTKPLWKG